MRILTLTAVLAAVAAVVAPTAALATHERPQDPIGNDFGSWYSWGEQRDAQHCDDAVDPISALFYGRAVNARGGIFLEGNDARNGHIVYHLGGDTHGPDEFEADQFHEQGACRRSVENQPAARAGFENDRWHVRLWHNVYRTSLDQPVMMATPHFEDWVEECGEGLNVFGNHAVESNADNADTQYGGSGFDRGRRYVGRRFRGVDGMTGHGVTFHPYAGNDAPMRQCDGGDASSNGHVAYIAASARE